MVELDADEEVTEVTAVTEFAPPPSLGFAARSGEWALPAVVRGTPSEDMAPTWLALAREDVAAACADPSRHDARSAGQPARPTPFAFCAFLGQALEPTPLRTAQLSMTLEHSPHSWVAQGRVDAVACRAELVGHASAPTFGPPPSRDPAHAPPPNDGGANGVSAPSAIERVCAPPMITMQQPEGRGSNSRIPLPVMRGTPSSFGPRSTAVTSSIGGAAARARRLYRALFFAILVAVSLVGYVHVTYSDRLSEEIHQFLLRCAPRRALQHQLLTAPLSSGGKDSIR